MGCWRRSKCVAAVVVVLWSGGLIPVYFLVHFIMYPGSALSLVAKPRDFVSESQTPAHCKHFHFHSRDATLPKLLGYRCSFKPGTSGAADTLGPTLWEPESVEDGFD